MGCVYFQRLSNDFCSVLNSNLVVKTAWWFYLLYLVYDWCKGKQTPETTDDDFFDKETKLDLQLTVGSLGTFWATVCLVELMDMAFSIDNVFAAVAFTPNIILVCVGVFIGILAMRFIAQGFVKLMEKYTFLETAAFVVIGILGIKLSLSLYEHFYPETSLSRFLTSHTADIGISVLTVAIFFVPIFTSLFFNFPKKQIKED